MERGLEHWRQFREGNEGSHIFKHHQIHHGGAGEPAFHLRPVKYCRTALERQVGEAVRIHSRGEAVLNSRTEYNRCHITRLSLPPEAGKAVAVTEEEGYNQGQLERAYEDGRLRNMLENTTAEKRGGTALPQKAGKRRRQLGQLEVEQGTAEQGDVRPTPEDCPDTQDLPPSLPGEEKLPCENSPVETCFEITALEQIAKSSLDSKGVNTAEYSPASVPKVLAGEQVTLKEGLGGESWLETAVICQEGSLVSEQAEPSAREPPHYSLVQNMKPSLPTHDRETEDDSGSLHNTNMGGGADVTCVPYSYIKPYPLPKTEDDLSHQNDTRKENKDDLKSSEESEDNHGDLGSIATRNRVEKVEQEDKNSKDNLLPKTEDDLYVFCKKDKSRCYTHNVELVSRKAKAKVWRTGRDGTNRRVYKIVESFVCPAFLVGIQPVTEPLGGNSNNFTTTTTTTTR